MKQVFIAFDQLLNTLLFFLPGGCWADETLSARAWRCRNIKPFTWLCPALDVLFFWDVDQYGKHCQSSYESELMRFQSPPEERLKQT